MATQPEPTAQLQLAADIYDEVRAFNRTIRALQREINVEDGGGLAEHYVRALRRIGREPIRPARLAEALRVTPRAVTDVVDGLVTRGYAERKADPNDRRAQIVSITDAGREAVVRAHQNRTVLVSERLSVLSPSEREELLDLLRRVNEESENYLT